MNPDENTEASVEDTPEARAARRKEALEKLIDHNLFTGAVTIAVTRAPGGKLHIVTSLPHYHTREHLGQILDQVYVACGDTAEEQQANALAAARAMVTDAVRTLDEAIGLMLEKVRAAAGGSPEGLSVVSDAVAQVDAFMKQADPRDN